MKGKRKGRVTIMASQLKNLAHSIVNWATAADSRYREARKMMELDEHILADIGITRQELLEELGIRKVSEKKAPSLGRRQANYWSSLANQRISRRAL